jgi:hypothetical protein
LLFKIKMSRCLALRTSRQDLGFARVIPSRPSLYRLVDTSALPSDVVTEEVDWGTTPYVSTHWVLSVLLK